MFFDSSMGAFALSMCSTVHRYALPPCRHSPFQPSNSIVCDKFLTIKKAVFRRLSGAYQHIPAHTSMFNHHEGVHKETPSPCRPQLCGNLRHWRTGASPLWNGGATAPSVPLASVPLRHVVVVLLPSIGLAAAATLLFYAGPVLAGLLYIECTADLSNLSTASPPAVP